MVVVVNAARKSWQDGSYGVWVGGGGSFKQVYCSQVCRTCPQPAPITALTSALPARPLACSTVPTAPGPPARPAQDAEYGGAPTWVSNDEVAEYDGRIYLNLPASCTLVLVQQG